MKRQSESGQMAIELVVLLPVVIIVSLIVFNAARFCWLASRFDRVCSVAVVTQGVSASGEQDGVSAAEAVRAAVTDAFASPSCSVSVVAHAADETKGNFFSLIPPLTKYICTLTYTVVPSGIEVAGVALGNPLTLVHERSIVVDRYRAGVVV